LNDLLCLNDTAKKAEFVAAQWKQAKGPQSDVTCGCGLKLPLRFAFRCLYCGEWYCQTCAEKHFGKTREQYNAEKDGTVSEAKPMGPWTGGYHWDERHNADMRGCATATLDNEARKI
jgi:hypothetical protein